MQTLYTYFQTEGMELSKAETELNKSISNIYNLYIYLLSALTEVRDFAETRQEEARQKFLPTEEDLNPNSRFVNNQVLAQLMNNRDLKKKIQKNRINWADHQEIFRRIFTSLKETEYYKKYMESSRNSYAADRDVVYYLLGDVLLENEAFLGLVEDNNIAWVNDLLIAVFMITKTLNRWNANTIEETELPALLAAEDDEGDNLMRDFVIPLMRHTAIHSKEFDQLIAAKAENWEFERIALMDVILIKMALTEFLYLPSIPVKVTINEYIEIAKEYSTQRSGQFINGILDKLSVDLKNAGRLNKSGRGLIE